VYEIYKIIISVNNNEEVMTFPHVPIDFPMELPPQNNETYEGLSRSYNRIGTMGLRTLQWSGFLPIARRMHNQDMYVRQFGYNPDAVDAWEYVKFFEKWRPKQLPFRLVFLHKDGHPILNMPCTVDTFTYTICKNGDLNYTIHVTEYVFIEEKKT